jgi:phytoene synthase
MTAVLADPEAPTTERQASGSSFYAAMRLLPLSERTAMFAVYAFCREVDDVADEPGLTTAERLAELDAWRNDVTALYQGRETKRTLHLVEPVRRFSLRQEDFRAIIDGMQMDAEGPIRAPTFETLDLYCDRVASAVGRLSVHIFGMPDAPGLTLAHHLGRALQLTNILRDLDEDAAMGRLYLPAEALAAAGIASREPQAVVNHSNIDRACRWVAERARAHYEAADAVLKARPPGRLRSPRLMREVYDRILRGMEATGWAPPRRRFKIGKGRLIWIILRHGLSD